MNKLSEVKQIEEPVSDMPDNRCPLFTNGQFVLGRCDEAGNILEGEFEPFNPANMIGRPIMCVMNKGPGSVQVEHRKGKDLVIPSAGVFFPPQTLAIDFIAGEVTEVRVTLHSPDKAGISIDRMQASNVHDDGHQRKQAKAPKWKVSNLYKSTPKQFEISDWGGGEFAIIGAPNVFAIVEKHKLSLMMIMNEGPGAALIKGSGHRTVSLGAMRAMLTLVGRTEVAMVEGETASIMFSVNAF
jgi:hypothetical protein